MPGGCRTRSIAEPECFRMQSGISPSGHEHAHQIRLRALRRERNQVKHLLHDSGLLGGWLISAPGGAGKGVGRRPEVVIRKQKLFPSHCRSEDHLAVTVGLEDGVELGAVDFTIDEVVRYG